jgi:hypothetical protein
LFSKRRKERPRMRWLDSDLMKMKVKGWKEKRGGQSSPRAVVPSGRKELVRLDYEITVICHNPNQCIASSLNIINNMATT